MSRIEEIRRCRTDLEIVRAAIQEVLQHGQSVSADGVAYNRATLFRLELREEEKRIAEEAAMTPERVVEEASTSEEEPQA